MANIPFKSITFPGLPNKYTVPEISNDLMTAGKAADAKATGDALSALEDQFNEETDQLKADLGDLCEDLGYASSPVEEIVLPDGYKSANYINSAQTVKIVYADDVLTFQRKWTAVESASNGRTAINDSHVSLTIDDTMRFKLTASTNAELRYKSSATDNYEKFSLELKVYNSDYSASKTFNISFESGTETLNILNIDDFVTDNNIDVSVYYNLVVYGLRWLEHTTVVNETAKIEIIGYADAGGEVSQTIVERVVSLESGLSGQEEAIEGIGQQAETTEEKVTNVENLLLMNETEPSKEINLTSPNIGYLMDNGRIVKDSNYGYTDLLNVVGGADYKFKALIFGNISLCWYDSTGSYISGVSGSALGGTQSTALEFTLTAPDSASYVRISHKINASKAFSMQQLTDVDTSNIIEKIGDKLSGLDALPTLSDAEIYFACGDSITHANHNGVSQIDLTDPFMPSGGTEGYTYNTKNYAYHIAKRHCMKWYNFGIGGTTLTQCSVAGDDKKGFATPNGRYTQLADGVTPDYITIFFGWNDKTHGPIQQRELWLADTYGSTIFYPQTASKIGTTGYATQAQYEACNAVTGEVGGVTYNNNAEYFFAKFIGTITDTDPKTWYGAWNTVLPYLIQKYPLAKIMPIVPYSSVQDEDSILGINMMMKQAVRNVAEKWGLAYFDFDSDEHQEFLATNPTPIGEHANIKAFRKTYLLADAVHPSNGGYKYMANMIGSKLMSI